MRKLLVIGGAFAMAVYVLRRRRRAAAQPAGAGDGSSPAGSDELRRFVEASERQRTP